MAPLLVLARDQKSPKLGYLAFLLFLPSSVFVDYPLWLRFFQILLTSIFILYIYFSFMKSNTLIFTRSSYFISSDMTTCNFLPLNIIEFHDHIIFLIHDYSINSTILIIHAINLKIYIIHPKKKDIYI